MPNPLRTASPSPCLSLAAVLALGLPAAALAGARLGDAPAPPVPRDVSPDDAPPPGAQSARLLDAVQVRAARQSAIEAERALTPGGVSVVDAEAFHARKVDNLADALRYVPGVWTDSTTGGDAIFLSSRGSNLDATDYDGNGVALFQDGLPVTTADGNNHNRFIDPMAARTVGVARGANALTYGASTLGGAIDFVSATARNGAPSSISVDGGDFGRIGARATMGGVAGDLDGQVTLEGRHRDGYREHGGQEHYGAYANAGWRATPALDLRVFATRLDDKQQLAGALTGDQAEADPRQANPSALTGNFQLNVRTTRVAGKGDWTIGDRRRLEFGLSYEKQALYHPIVDKIMVDSDGPGPAPPVEVFSLLKNTEQRTLAGMIRYHAVVGEHDVLAGANLADTREAGGNYRNDGGRRNGRSGIIDNRSGSAALFLVDRWRFAPGWILVYGAQGVFTGRDVRNVDLVGGTERRPNGGYTAFNPRLGLIRALGAGAEAYASIGRLYEAPTTFELEDDVRADGSTLEAMRGGVAEVGIRGATTARADAPRWHWDASLYYAALRDEILSVDDPQAPGTSLSTNVDRTIHAGLEALVGASLAFGGGAHRIEPLLGATWNAFAFDGDASYGDNTLPAAPAYAMRGEVMYRHAGGFFAGPTFDLVGARWADFANTYKVGSYRLLGLRAGIERPRWQLYGELRNLLDEHYVATLGVRDRAAADAAILQPGMPRSVYVGMRLRF